MQADTIVRLVDREQVEQSVCVPTSTEQILESLSKHRQVYLLLDTPRLLQFHYETPSASAMEMPKTPTLNKVIGEVDPFTTRRFVWEKTKFDDRKESGPVLIELDADSPLIEKYITNWSHYALGALITSDAPIDTLQKHLSEFIEVDREAGGPVKLNVECPSKLSCVFEGISEVKLTDCLGPIDKMYWSESIESKQRWFLAKNSGSKATTSKVMFSEFDFENIQSNIQNRFITNAVHTIKNEIIALSDAGNSLPSSVANADDHQIRQWVSSGWVRGCEHGFTSDIELLEFIRIVLFHKVKLSDQRLEPYLLNIKKSPELRLVTVKRYLESGEQYAA